MRRVPYQPSAMGDRAITGGNGPVPRRWKRAGLHRRSYWTKQTKYVQTQRILSVNAQFNECAISQDTVVHSLGTDGRRPLKDYRRDPLPEVSKETRSRPGLT